MHYVPQRLQAPLGPARGALQLEARRGLATEADVVEDVAEGEPGGADEGLGALHGVGVDDVDAEDGVVGAAAVGG